MKKLIFVLVSLVAVALISTNALAKSAPSSSVVTDTSPKIATEPYAGGGSSQTQTMTIQEAQKTLEQGKKTAPVDGKSSTPPPNSDIPGVPEDESPAGWNTMKRVYYGAGVMGGGFMKDAKLGCTGFSGAYSFFEFRFSKVVGLNFDTYGGWLFGDGNFYYSGPNVGVRIYPMAYSNPKFEFLIEAGGHPLEIVTGNDRVGGTAMGQGGYGGLGIIIRPDSGMFGVMIGARTSILWMQGPADDGSTNKKRRLSIPVMGMTAIVF